MESKRAPEFVLKWNGSIANAYASIKLINLNKFTLFDVIKSVSFNLCRRFMRCYAHFWLISWLLLVDTKPNKLPTNFTWLLTVWILCSFALFRASLEEDGIISYYHLLGEALQSRCTHIKFYGSFINLVLPITISFDFWLQYSIFNETFVMFVRRGKKLTLRRD